MPYIKQDQRRLIDPIITELANKLALVSPETRTSAGVLNYAITRLIYYAIHSVCYAEFNRMIGVLECVKQELYRRVVAGYEDDKAKANGDVYGEMGK